MPYRKRNESDGDQNQAAQTRSHHSSLAVEIPIYLLVMTSPLAIGTVHVSSVVVMWILSNVAFISLLIRSRRHKLPIKLFSLGTVLLLMSMLTALQLIPLPYGFSSIQPGSRDILETVLHGTAIENRIRPLSLAAPHTALELVKLLMALLTFLTVVNYFNDRHRALRLCKVISWSGFLVALIGFFSSLFMLKSLLGFYPVAKGVFFFSTFVNPNHLAGFLLMSSPIALAISLASSNRQDQALYGFMGTIIGVAVLMTLSRGGIIAYIASLVFFVFLVSGSTTKKLKRSLKLQSITALVLMIAGYLAYDSIVKEMTTLGDLEAIREEAKVEVWKQSLPMIADFPIFGIGHGAFPSIFKRYQTGHHQLTFTHIENEVLQVLVDWGPVFGGIILLGLVASFLLGLRRVRNSTCLAGCSVALFGILCHNLVDFNLTCGAVLITFVAIFALLLASPFPRSAKPTPFELRLRLGHTGAWAMVVASFVGTCLAIPTALGNSYVDLSNRLLAVGAHEGAEPCDATPLGQASCDLLYYHPGLYITPLALGRAYMQQAGPNLKRGAHWLSVAMMLNPTEPHAHHLVGRALFMLGQTKQALMEYRRAAELLASEHKSIINEVLSLSNNPTYVIEATPKNATALLKTAQVLRELNLKKEAIQACHIALEYDSSNLRILDMLSRLSLELGRLTEADSIAQKMISIDPQQAKAWMLRGQVQMMRGKSETAERIWREASELIPDSTHLATRLVNLYLRQSRNADAEAVVSRLKTFSLSDDRTQAQLMFLMGKIHAARNSLSDARAYYEQATQMQPDNLNYLYQLGLVDEKIGAWDSAQRIYHKLQQLNYHAKEMSDRQEIIKKARQIESERAFLSTSDK